MIVNRKGGGASPQYGVVLPRIGENCKLPELYLRADANVDKVMDEGIEEDEEPKHKKKPKD